MFFFLAIKRIQDNIKDIAGCKEKLRKDSEDKYLFQHISELENFNRKAKQSQRAQSHADDDKRTQTTNGSISGINFRETPRLRVLRSEVEKRQSDDTISGRRISLRAPEPVPTTLIRVDDVLAVSLNCSEREKENISYTAIRGDSFLSPFLASKSWTARRAKSVARAILGPTLSPTLTRSSRRALAKLHTCH